jgi:hypothetical protein
MTAIDKIRKIKPYGYEYAKRKEQLANELLIIKPCKTCGSPVAYPYCCTFCGETDP